MDLDKPVNESSISCNEVNTENQGKGYKEVDLLYWEEEAVKKVINLFPWFNDKLYYIDDIETIVDSGEKYHMFLNSFFL